MTRPRGNPKLDQQRNRDTTAANESRSAQADAFAADLLPVLYELVLVLGVTGLSEQAEWLNANGHPTRRKNHWSASSLKQFYARVKARGIRPRPGVGYVITDDDLHS